MIKLRWKFALLCVLMCSIFFFTFSNMVVNTRGCTAAYLSESTQVSGVISEDTTPPVIFKVSQSPHENNVHPEDMVKVNATVHDFLSEITFVGLNYTTGNGTWILVDMTNIEGDIWNATIPAFPKGTNVTYLIVAEDAFYNAITTYEAFGYNYQYEVIPKFSPLIPLSLLMIAIPLAALLYYKKFSRQA
jgi:hypothetical protein